MTKGGDSLLLGSKTGVVRVWVPSETVWSPCYTRVISERFTDKGLIIKRCINSSVRTLLFYFTVSNRVLRNEWRAVPYIAYSSVERLDVINRPTSLWCLLVITKLLRHELPLRLRLPGRNETSPHAKPFLRKLCIDLISLFTHHSCVGERLRRQCMASNYRSSKLNHTPLKIRAGVVNVSFLYSIITFRTPCKN